MARNTFQIGDLANATGLTPDTIRYYERQKLLPRAERTAGGFRTYDASAVDRIEFVRRAKAHGLTLREIKELCERALAGQSKVECPVVEDLGTRRKSASK
jgi:DNA-binding transcriptional MerR regulator